MALIVPKLYADLVRETYETKAIMRSLATDVGVLDIHEVGQKVVFPRWKNIGNAEDMTNFTMSTGELTAEALAQDSSEATVKQIGKAVYVRDFDNLTALGNQIQEAGTQTGIVLARQVDIDLLKNVTESGTAITAVADAEENMNLLFNVFGDDQDVDSFAGFIIHSSYISELLKSRLFVDATTTTAFDASGIVRNGLVGFYRGVPVYLSNRMGDVTQPSGKKYKAILLKKNAIGYMEKRAIMVEEDRQPKKGGSDVVANLMYATHFLMKYPVQPGAGLLAVAES